MCWQLRDALGVTSLLLLVLPFVSGVNHFCSFAVPSSRRLVSFEGKMNVPVKPLVEPGKVLFLWPAIDPSGDMMQPVLTYGADYGQGAGKWGMANWYTDCPGYCHDPYQAVDEGETLTFSMRYVKTFPNASRQWIMHWSALNSGQSSSYVVNKEKRDAEVLWGTEAEFYLDSSDPANYDKLPQSSFYTWDILAVADDGSEIPVQWTTNGDISGDLRVNCEWADAKGHNGTELKMPGPHSQCADGYSRTYDYGCNSFCGCTNKDGSPKVECDYCCSESGGTCHRQQGPSRTSNETVEFVGPLPVPGQLARHVMRQADIANMTVNVVV